MKYPAVAAVIFSVATIAMFASHPRPGEVLGAAPTTTPATSTQSAGPLAAATEPLPPTASSPVPLTAPAAPSNPRLTGEADGLAWTDNSTDETGFEITATDNVSATVQKFSVPANTTSFQLPPGARASCADHRRSMSYEVIAVNAAGSSEQASAAIRSGCPGGEAPVTADTMVVSGFAPAGPGVTVVIEALDVATIHGIECARGETVEANAAGPGFSRFSLTVERDCVQRASGLLRVCWSEGKCQGSEFQPGHRLDLGIIVLRTPIASAPDVGFGPNARDGSDPGDTLIRTLVAAGLALVGAGVLLFVGSLLAHVRRRYGR